MHRKSSIERRQTFFSLKMPNLLYVHEKKSNKLDLLVRFSHVVTMWGGTKQTMEEGLR